MGSDLLANGRGVRALAVTAERLGQSGEPE
jgi:hypothetical protein